MKVQEILLEQAMPQKNLVERLRQLEPTLNLHVAKLVAFDAREETRSHWRSEVRGHLRTIMRFRLKSSGRPAAKQLYLDELFEHIYGEPEVVAVANIASLCQQVAEDYPGMHRNARTDHNVWVEMGQWWDEVADLLSRGQDAMPMAARL